MIKRLYAQGTAMSLNLSFCKPHRQAIPHANLHTLRRIAHWLCPVFCILYMSSHFSIANAQTADKGDTAATIRLQVGSRVPAQFWQEQHLIYRDGDTSYTDLSAYKGKLLILDFWSTGCALCLHHQAAINAYKQHYGDKLKVLMVNSIATGDTYTNIAAFHKRHQAKYFTADTFESIIMDDVLHDYFHPRGYPHYIWINSSGFVETISFRNLLDSEARPPFYDKEAQL